MTRSSKDAAVHPASFPAPSPAARLLLALFLAADFMVFAALIGAGIVLREGGGIWIAAPASASLREFLPLGVLAALALIPVLFLRGKKANAAALATAFFALGFESVLSLRASPPGSYGVFSLLLSDYVLIHLLACLGWLAKRSLRHSQLLGPFRLFTATTGIAALLAVHWPLYS